MKPITYERNIPGFTAEAALRQPSVGYQMAGAREALTDGRQVVPQWCYSPRPGLHCCWTPWLGWRCFRFHDVA